MRVYLLSFIFLSSLAQASYRVYQLRINTFHPSGTKKKIRVVLTSLDHLQYENYHGTGENMKIELLDSWYCPGDTSFNRIYCRRPQGGRKPASSNDYPKRTPFERVQTR